MKFLPAILVGTIAAYILVGLLLAFPVMLLWNACLVPAVPSILEIGWLQAWGLTILIGLLTNKASIVTEKS